jgi:hypothetical protein
LSSCLPLHLSLPPLFFFHPDDGNVTNHVCCPFE